MLPPGMEWREITLGMLSMISSMIWEKNKKRVYVIILTIVAIYFARKTLKQKKQAAIKAKLTKQRKERQNERDYKCDLLKHSAPYSKQKEDITKLSFRELKVRFNDDSLKPTEVLEAYQMKAAMIHQQTNCLVDVIEEAKEQSLQLERENNKEKLLYGIPVSLKENYDVKGYNTNMGCSYYLDNIADEDAAIVKILKHHGAIPFVKTNVPQTMMSAETCNPIYGQTRNPHNLGRSSSGSTGGEGALIAAGGSLLGYGTDIGGSIRIPAHINGTCGFKPTLGRCSKKGIKGIIAGQTCVTGNIGPLARDMETIVTGFRAMVDPIASEVDFQQPNITFNDEVYSSDRKLKVGFYTFDGAINATKSCQRAVEEAVTILQHQGHQVHRWDFKNYGARGYVLAKKAFSADGNQTMKKVLQHDAIEPETFFVRYMPWISYKNAAFIHQQLHPQSMLHDVIKAKSGLKSIASYYQLFNEVKEFQEEVTKDWKREGFDVVLCPAFACQAPRIGDMKFTEGAGTYTAVYNTLNYPAGVVPITKVTSEDLQEPYPILDNTHKQIYKSLPGSEGLPIGVQVVALTWQDELCLRVMKEIETGVAKK